MADGKGKQSKFEMVIGAVDRFSGVFKGFNDRIDGAAKKMSRLQAAGESLSNATGFSRLSGAVAGVAGGMKNVAGEGKKLVSNLSGMAGKLSMLMGLGGGGALALAKGTADAAAGIGKLSRQAGMGVTLFQEYAHAAEQAGIGNDELASGIGNIRQMAIDAFKGKGQAKSILSMAGINPKTAKGEIKSADSLFLELADKVQKLQAAGKDLQAENLLKGFFGSDGTKFLPMLKDGAQGLLAARKEAAKYGMFSDKDIQNANKFNVVLGNAWKGVKGFGFALGAPFLEPLTKLVDKFTAWGLAQKDVLKGGSQLEQWADRFSAWIDKLEFDQVSASIGRFVEKIDTTIKFLGGLGPVFAAVAAVISGKFLWSIGSLILSFGKLGTAITLTPFGWFMLACAAIGAAVYVIYKNWDGIVAYFQGLWSEVKDAFSKNWTEGILKALWNFFPARLVLKGMNELVAYFTGFNFLEIGAGWVDSIQKGFAGGWGKFTAWFWKQIESLTGWLPDFMKKKLGFGDTGAAFGGNAAGKIMAEPMNLAPAARGIAETRSERVERNEVRVKFDIPPGFGNVSLTGNPGDGVSLQTGQLATGY